MNSPKTFPLWDLVSALMLRILGPASFIGIVMLISRSISPDVAGEFVALLSFAFIASILAKFGFQQLIF